MSINLEVLQLTQTRRMETQNFIFFFTYWLYAVFLVFYKRVQKVYLKLPQEKVFYQIVGIFNYLEALPAESDLEKAHLKCTRQMYKL